MKVKTARIRKKDKKETKVIEQGYSLKSLITIIIVISFTFCVFYLITPIFIKPSLENEEVPSVIDESQITLNQLLNRREAEYYVLATKDSLYSGLGYINVNYNDLYNSYINKYLEQDNSLKFYYVDLDNALNKKFISEELNISDNINELKINDEILFKIKDGIIEKTYVGNDEIIDKLSRL